MEKATDRHRTRQLCARLCGCDFGGFPSWGLTALRQVFCPSWGLRLLGPVRLSPVTRFHISVSEPSRARVSQPEPEGQCPACFVALVWEHSHARVFRRRLWLVSRHSGTGQWLHKAKMFTLRFCAQKSCPPVPSW